jgi:hypothetical protein
VKERSFTHVSYLLTAASVNAGRVKRRAGLSDLAESERAGKIRGVHSCGTRGKVTRIVNAILASLILFLTVVVSLSAGVFMAYWTMNGLLLALGHRRQEPTPVLVQRHASGD